MGPAIGRSPGVGYDSSRQGNPFIFGSVFSPPHASLPDASGIVPFSLNAQQKGFSYIINDPSLLPCGAAINIVGSCIKVPFSKQQGFGLMVIAFSSRLHLL